MALDEEETVVKRCTSNVHPHNVSESKLFFSFDKLFLFLQLSAIIPPSPHQWKGVCIEALGWGKYGPLLLKSLNYQKLCTFENWSDNATKI